MLWIRDVGDRVVVPACGAQAVGRARRDQPVADVVVGVGAEATGAVGADRRPLSIARRFQGGHHLELREKAEPMAAAPASPVLEVNDIVADLTPEELHGSPGTLDLRNSRKARSFLRRSCS